MDSEYFASFLKMEWNFSFLFILIKFSWWFFTCFDKLFSALDRKAELSVFKVN